MEKNIFDLNLESSQKEGESASAATSTISSLLEEAYASIPLELVQRIQGDPNPDPTPWPEPVPNPDPYPFPEPIPMPHDPPADPFPPRPEPTPMPEPDPLPWPRPRPRNWFSIDS